MSTDTRPHDSPPANAACKAGRAQELSPQHLAALEALLTGKSVSDAAATAGVDRSTLHGWLRKNFAFQAALNRGRLDLRQAIVHRLERLANDATERVAKAVGEGDLKTALAIVKCLDVFAPRYLDSDDAAELRIDEEERCQDMEERAESLRDARTRSRMYRQ